MSIHDKTNSVYSIYRNEPIYEITLKELGIIKEFLPNWNYLFEIDEEEVSFDDFEELCEISDKKLYLKIDQYYIDNGISFLTLDINKANKVNHIYTKPTNEFTGYIIKGDLYKSYGKEFDFFDDPLTNIDILLSESAFIPLKENKSKLKKDNENYLIYYRSSSKSFGVKVLSKEEFYLYKEFQENELIDLFFSKIKEKVEKKKEYNDKYKGKLYDKIISDFNDGIKLSKNLEDSYGNYTIERMVIKGYDDNKIHDFSKSFPWSNSEYSNSETQSQINYFRRKNG